MPCCVAIAQAGDEKQRETKVEEILEELFLGEVVFPQERGELQFTPGFFWSHKREDDLAIPVLLEYGITDRLQIMCELPVELADEAAGLGNVELGGYCNFFSDANAGRAYGAGVGLALPTATTDVGEEAVIFEPFFIAYQEVGRVSVNVFTKLEIEAPISGEEDTQIGGEIGLALFGQLGRFVPLLELGVEIEEDETAVRIAPAIVWQPRRLENAEFGVSLPVGVTEQTPDLGVFVLMTWEFGGH